MDLNHVKRDTLIQAVRFLTGSQVTGKEAVELATTILFEMKGAAQQKLDINVDKIIRNVCVNILLDRRPDAQLLRPRIQAAALLREIEQDEQQQKKHFDNLAKLLYQLCPSDLVGIIQTSNTLSELRKRLADIQTVERETQGLM